MFVKVWGTKRIKELIHSKYAALSIYVNTDGHIQKVDYYLEINSALTLKEVDKITTALKKTIAFQVPSTTKKRCKAVAIYVRSQV